MTPRECGQRSTSKVASAKGHPRRRRLHKKDRKEKADKDLGHPVVLKLVAPEAADQDVEVPVGVAVVEGQAAAAWI